MTDNREIPICVLPHAAGWHVASWRRPSAPEKDIWNPRFWVEVAKTAERGKLDALFIADLVALWPTSEALRHRTAHVGQWEAFTLLSALSMVTDSIGLVATGHTEYNNPYNIARMAASLDHLSGGRAGWNVVTSSGSAQAHNYGQDGRDTPEVRYERAAEFVEVVKKLWDSWEDDAYVRDRESGVFFDPEKLHVADHHGKYYDVKGPLNVMRPVQGYPVLAQAGSSGPGKHLAASIGELIFTPHTGAASKAFREEILERGRALGRPEGSIKVLSQLTPIIGATQAEADAKWHELQSLAHPDLARATLEMMIGVNLKGVPLDEPIPDDVWGDVAVTGYRDAVMDFVREKNPTVRELIFAYKGPGNIVGTPESVADYIEAEVDSGACDGFNLLIHGNPEELNDFVDMVVPELQRRGRFKTDYAGKTLRENLGFARPDNRFANAKATA